MAVARKSLDYLDLRSFEHAQLEGALRERTRTIIRQVCRELGVQIVSGVLSREHVHMFVENPPHIAVSDFVRRVKGRSSHRAQMGVPGLAQALLGGGISGLGAKPVVIQYTATITSAHVALRTFA